MCRGQVCPVCGRVARRCAYLIVRVRRRGSSEDLVRLPHGRQERNPRAQSEREHGA